MTRRILIVCLALTLLLSAPLPAQSQPGTTKPPDPSLRLLHSAENGVVLELTTPGYEMATETMPAGIFQRLTIPGYGATAELGKPQIPVVGALLGVPADAQIELRLLADDAVLLPGHFVLTPVPRPAPLADDLQPGGLLYELDAAAYASDAPYPPALARLAEDAWLRDQRVVRVEFYPFQYNPVQMTLLWHQRLQVELRFVGAQSPVIPPRPSLGEGGRGVRADSFEPVLRLTLLNYDSARAWRVRPVAGDQLGLPKAANSQSAIRNPQFKVVVDHDGLYRLTYADLQAAGMDVDTADPRTFHLTSQGQDVAIYVAGEADGRFDPGDFILFYGQKFRGAILAERYAEAMAPWLTLCPECQLAGLLEKYTDENVYWLTIDGEPGPRMAARDGTPSGSTPISPHFLATVHAEESHFWWTWHFTNEDTWFWDRVQTGPVSVVTRTYTTTLTAPDLTTSPSPNRGGEGEGYTATVRAEVVARSSNPSTAPDHHTRFCLNGALLEDGTWDGPTRHHVEAAVPQNVLHEGINALDFVIVNDAGLSADDIYFDWFEVTYPRRFVAAADQLTFTGDLAGTWRYELTGFAGPDIQVYDITDPLAPQRVLTPTVTATGGAYTATFQDTHDAGAQYLALAASAAQSPKRLSRYVSPDLKSTTNGADYIFITHRDFYTATQTLAAYRQTQGLRTIVVDVDDLYNEFNDGIYHPIAIRNFLAYAYANWQPPAPAYVLLVGDGHWNFKGYGVERYGPPEPIYMPPNLAFVDPWQGEVDSANLLAAIVGNDILPDLFVGRLPVNSEQELNAIIAKIMAYESAAPWDWQRHVLFVADNVPDSAGDFVATSNSLADQLPARCQADRIYLNDYCGPPASPPQPCPAVNNAITSTLNMTGALLVNYVGHGSVERWAHEQIFVNGDILSLANGDRLPVVLSMTCLDGYWLYPNRPCLAEELLRAEGRGAVATWSPTGLGVSTGHEVLDRGFYTAVFRDGVRQLGPATLAGKLALYATGGDYDLIYTFTIFGDPALHLPVPPWQVYLPIIRK